MHGRGRAHRRTTQSFEDLWGPERASFSPFSLLGSSIFLMDEGIATHFSILAWRIPWTEEPGGLQSMWSLRVRHDWATNIHSLIFLKDWLLLLPSCPSHWTTSNLPRIHRTSAETQGLHKDLKVGGGGLPGKIFVSGPSSFGTLNPCPCPPSLGPGLGESVSMKCASLAKKNP